MKSQNFQKATASFLILSALLVSYQNCAPPGKFSAESATLASTSTSDGNSNSGQQQSDPVTTTLPSTQTTVTTTTVLVTTTTMVKPPPITTTTTLKPPVTTTTTTTVTTTTTTIPVPTTTTTTVPNPVSTIFLKADPNFPYSSLTATGLQLNGTQINPQTVSEATGALGNPIDGLVNFKRVTDPDDSQKKAFLFQVAERDNAGSTGGQRTEMAWHPLKFGFDIGQTYWTAIRVRIGENIKNTIAEDEVLIWQLHENTGQAGLNPNIVLVATGGGANAEIFSRVKYSSNPVPSLAANAKARLVYSYKGYPANKWITYVMQFKLHHTDGNGAFLKMWKDGVLVTNDTLPNAYNAGQEKDPLKRNYEKFGIYHYYHDLWKPGEYRTLHHKGVVTYKDDGKITEPMMRKIIEGY